MVECIYSPFLECDRAIFSDRVTNPGFCNFLFLEEFVILLTDGTLQFKAAKTVK